MKNVKENEHVPEEQEYTFEPIPTWQLMMILGIVMFGAYLIKVM